MQELIERICARLQSNAYVNEAAISHGIVTPIIAALGWDSADPHQLVPEYNVGSGRVDFALIGLSRKPVIFIEVKAVGKATDADRQVFEYAFHQGVPLCVLTDGRDWSFYLPSGVGSYEDRRVYRLQLDERTPEECERIFERYLSRDRVRSGKAFTDAQQDHQQAAASREAAALLPKAWADLVAEPHELIVEIVAEKAESLSGFRPSEDAVIQFLSALRSSPALVPPSKRVATQPAAVSALLLAAAGAKPVGDKSVRYTLFGETAVSPNASRALVDILRAIVRRDPSRLPALAEAVRTPRMAHVAMSPAEINPRNPSIARAVDISPGWMVGLNIDNKTKFQIIVAACGVWDLRMPDDLSVEMPNT